MATTEQDTGASTGFLDPGVLKNPFPVYDMLQQHAPVFQVPEMGFYVVSRYDDVMRVLRDDQTFSSRLGEKFTSGLSLNPPRESVQAVLAGGYPHVDTLAWVDPPEHTRQRTLVSSAFSPRRVRLLEEAIRAHSEELVAGWADGGEVEFVGEFSAPLPIAVIGEALGVDPQGRDRFRVWTDAVLNRIGMVLTEEEDITEARRVVEFQHFMKALVDKRRAHNQDDMLSDLINATAEGEQPLSTPELLGIVLILLVAGNGTTQSLMTSMMHELLQRPEILTAVREDRSLLPKALEETLRLQAPVLLFTRVTTRDVEVAGVEIPADSLVMPLFHAANVDPTQFPDPLEFRLDRENQRAHLGFGFGIHYCLGAVLGKAEATIGFNVLLDHFSRFELAEGFEPSYKASFWHRGIPELRLRVHR